MNKAVQKVSFEFRLGLVIHFLHALAGGGVILLFLKHLLAD